MPDKRRLEYVPLTLKHGWEKRAPKKQAVESLDDVGNNVSGMVGCHFV